MLRLQNKSVTTPTAVTQVGGVSQSKAGTPASTIQAPTPVQPAAASVKAAADRIATTTADMVAMYRDPVEDMGGEVPFVRSFVDRSSFIRHTNYDVFQFSPEQGQDGAAVTAFKDPSTWSQIEASATTALSQALCGEGLTVMDTEVRKVLVQRYGTSAAYRVTLGGEGAPTASPPPAADKSGGNSLVGIRGKSCGGIADAGQRMAKNLLSTIEMYRDPEEDMFDELPWKHAYIARDSNVQMTDFEVFQYEPNVGIKGAGVDALTESGNWNAVEAAARKAIEKGLPDDLQLMDVQVLLLDRRRHGATVSFRAVVRHADDC